MEDDGAPTRRAKETLAHVVHLTGEQHATLEWIADPLGGICSRREEGGVDPAGPMAGRSQGAAWLAYEGTSNTVGPEAVFIHALRGLKPGLEPAL